MKRPNVPVQGQGFVQPEISQNDILIRHKAESRIDSRLFAERIGIKHKSLYSLIQKHKTGLRELGILPFQTERLKTNQHGEREHKFALLNSDQFDYMRHIVSHFAAERMKHVKQYLGFYQIIALVALYGANICMMQEWQAKQRRPRKGRQWR